MDPNLAAVPPLNPSIGELKMGAGRSWIQQDTLGMGLGDLEGVGRCVGSGGCTRHDFSCNLSVGVFCQGWEDGRLAGGHVRCAARAHHLHTRESVCGIPYETWGQQGGRVGGGFSRSGGGLAGPADFSTVSVYLCSWLVVAWGMVRLDGDDVLWAEECWLHLLWRQLVAFLWLGAATDGGRLSRPGPLESWHGPPVVWDPGGARGLPLTLNTLDFALHMATSRFDHGTFCTFLGSHNTKVGRPSHALLLPSRRALNKDGLRPPGKYGCWVDLSLAREPVPPDPLISRE